LVVRGMTSAVCSNEIGGIVVGVVVVTVMDSKTIPSPYGVKFNQLVAEVARPRRWVRVREKRVPMNGHFVHRSIGPEASTVKGTR
jgi:hypothetical protein